MLKLYDERFAVSRLSGTVILYKDKPAIVREVYREGGKIKLFLDVQGEDVKVDHEDPDVSHKPPKIGWCYLQNGRMAFISRDGKRQWKMGARVSRGVDYRSTFNPPKNVVDRIINERWAILGGCLYYKRLVVGHVIGDTPLFSKGMEMFEEIFKREGLHV